MNNIFENAYFGKAYKARNGRKALYYKGVFDRPREGANHVTLLLEPNEEMFEGFLHYKLDGTAQGGHSHLDIVSEWKEEIDEEELHDLSCACYPCDGETDARSFHKGFKIGYRIVK